MTYGMYHYITTEFDHAKHDSCLAAYGGVVLQRFEFIKVCMGMQRLCLKSQLFLYFVNKIYLDMLQGESHVLRGQVRLLCNSTCHMSH